MEPYQPSASFKQDEKIAVVIPAKDEELSIQGVIEGIRAQSFDLDIVVVNDASSDGTSKILRQLGVTCISHMESLGAWQATQTGLIFAHMKGYPYVITMDADGQHLGCQLSKLIEEIEPDDAPDVIIGACRGRASFAKRLVWNMFRRLTGIKIEDITSGFRIYNSKALDLLISPRASVLEYQDVGVLLLLKSSGLKISEVSVEMDKRFDGDSRIFSSWYKVLYYLISTLIISLSKILHKSG